MSDKALSLTLLTEPVGVFPRRGKLFQTARTIIYPHNPASVIYDPVQGRYILQPDSWGSAVSQGEFVDGGLQMGTLSVAALQQPLALASDQTQSPCAPSCASSPITSAPPRSLGGNCPSAGCSSCPATGQVYNPPPVYTPGGLLGGSNQAPRPIPTCPAGVCPAGCPSTVSRAGTGVQAVLGAVTGWLTGKPCSTSLGCPACSAGSWNCPAGSSGQAPQQSSPCFLCPK